MKHRGSEKSVLIILTRHGNTFAPGETPCWIGARSDLPLVETGRAQALAVAQLLRSAALVPAEIICGPLQRTREFAQIICDQLTVPAAPTCDARLGELDYGDWEGLSDAEVIARGGAEQQRLWREQSIRPEGARWGGEDLTLSAESAALLDDLEGRLTANGSALCVTSNGRLRYLLRALPQAFEAVKARRELTVGTGKLALIRSTAGRRELVGWNVSVDEAARLFSDRLAPFCGAA